MSEFLKDCCKCGGTGEIEVVTWLSWDGNQDLELVTCEICKGNGKIEDKNALLLAMAKAIHAEVCGCEDKDCKTISEVREWLSWDDDLDVEIYASMHPRVFETHMKYWAEAWLEYVGS